MFSGLSIGKKIGFGFSALIMITMGLGFYSVIQLGNVNDTATEIKESWMPSIVAVSDLNISTSDFKIAALEHLSSLTEANMKEYEADQSRIHAHMLEVRAKYEKLITSPEEQKNYDEFSAAWAKYLVENEKIIQLSRQNKNEEAKELIRGKSKEYFDLANSRLVSLVDTNVKGGDEASDRGDAMYSSSLKLIVFAIGFCAASGAFIGWLLISSLSKALQKVISDLQSGSAHVTTASTEIAGASTEISASATQQASALQETVASITEITETVRGNTQNALKSKEIAEESEQVALRGKTVVSDMIISVEEIDKSNEDIKIQVNESNKQISEIITVINEIGNKTKVINDIVFQTKLLSFNASIEAARAGEHGKGFAVVAEEVGNLAQMSGTAANDISSMLSSSINKVEAIIHNTKTKVEELVVVSKKKVDAGLNQARRCDEVLENIVQKVSTAKTMAIEIAESSREQALGIGQIEKAMNELELVNNQNTTASQQCSVSAEELANQAENLNSMIHVLVETVEGKSAKKGVTTSAQVIDFDSHVKKDKSFDRVG